MRFCTLAFFPHGSFVPPARMRAATTFTAAASVRGTATFAVSLASRTGVLAGGTAGRPFCLREARGLLCVSGFCFMGFLVLATRCAERARLRCGFTLGHSGALRKNFFCFFVDGKKMRRTVCNDSSQNRARE